MSDPRLQRLNETENLAVGLATGVVDVSLTQWMLLLEMLDAMVRCSDAMGRRQVVTGGNDRL